MLHQVTPLRVASGVFCSTAPIPEEHQTSLLLRNKETPHTPYISSMEAFLLYLYLNTFYCIMPSNILDKLLGKRKKEKANVPEDYIILVDPVLTSLNYDTQCANSRCSQPNRLIPADTLIFCPNPRGNVVFHPGCAKCYSCDESLCPNQPQTQKLYQTTVTPLSRLTCKLGYTVPAIENAPSKFWMFFCRQECACDRSCHKCGFQLEVPVWELKTVCNVQPTNPSSLCALPASHRNELQYHVDCFVCYICGRRFDDSQLSGAGLTCLAGQVYCLDDLNNHTHHPPEISPESIKDVGKWDETGSFCDVAPATMLPEVEVSLRRPKVCHSDRESMFRREMVLWYNLTATPDIVHITKLYGVCNLDGSLRGVVERADGGNICQYLISNPKVDFLSLLFQAAKGLHSIHRNNCIHGNIRGETILIYGGVAKITHFGIARYLGQDVHAEDVAMLGPQAYKAPEILNIFNSDIRVQRSYSSDVYAFGITIAQVIATLDGKGLEGIWPEVDHKGRGGSVTKLSPFIRFMTSSVSPPCRPRRPDSLSPVAGALWDLAATCWDQEESKRPSMYNILNTLEEIETNRRTDRG